jgi:hypothetical protein
MGTGVIIGMQNDAERQQTADEMNHSDSLHLLRCAPAAVTCPQLASQESRWVRNLRSRLHTLFGDKLPVLSGVP